MKTLEQLLASHCREVTGEAMSHADVAAQLEVLDQWAFDNEALSKAYRFKNYYETVAFVNALATIVTAKTIIRIHTSGTTVLSTFQHASVRDSENDSSVPPSRRVF